MDTNAERIKSIRSNTPKLNQIIRGSELLALVSCQNDYQLCRINGQVYEFRRIYSISTTIIRRIKIVKQHSIMGKIVGFAFCQLYCVRRFVLFINELNGWKQFRDGFIASIRPAN